MHKKCWGCNKTNIPLLKWLSGDNLCFHCKNRITDSDITENYDKDSQEYQIVNSTRKKKVDPQAEKIIYYGKPLAVWFFGGIALLYFVVMLYAQPDFEAIVIGWLVIGIIYLLFRAKS